MKRFLPVLVVFAAVYLFQVFSSPDDWSHAPETPTATTAAPACSPDTTSPLIGGRQAKGSGTVVRVLPDDNDGSRQQRFIQRQDTFDRPQYGPGAPASPESAQAIRSSSTVNSVLIRTEV